MMQWQLGYLAISVAITIFVGHTLYRNGRIFLVDSFLGNEKLADSVNRLLLVGFYLLNLGYVVMAYRYGGQALTTEEAVEYLTMKVGVVLLVLGAIHMFNLYVFTRVRRRAIDEQQNRNRFNRLPQVLPADRPVR